MSDEVLERDCMEQKEKGKFGCLFFICLALVLLVFISVMTPLVFGRRKNSERTRAVGHATQVRLAINEFEKEYGCGPGQWVVDEGVFAGAKAESANDCFRQLLQGLPSVRTEVIFYVDSEISDRPDDDIGDESNYFEGACAPGEVGYLYIDAPQARSGAPIIAAPLAVGGGFDSDMYNGKAVILKSDGSVDVLKLEPESKKLMVKVYGGEMDLLDVKREIYGKGAVIKYPEPK